MKLQLNKRKSSKEKDIVHLIQKINELDKSGNITGLWKIAKNIKKTNTFNGVKELYDDNNIAISTEELKNIITSYIKTEFQTNIDTKRDIFEEINQI